jgi:hypothetical protein
MKRDVMLVGKTVKNNDNKEETNPKNIKSSE